MIIGCGVTRNAPESRATFETILLLRDCAPGPKIGVGAARGANLRRNQSRRSADFQSAVSRISNPLGVRQLERADLSNVLPIGNRRYSRLETCATTARASRSARSADFQSAVSRISNPQAAQRFERAGFSNGLPIGNRRPVLRSSLTAEGGYSRLETCAMAHVVDFVHRPV